MNQIKRFAGASAGAMTASLMAVGYNSKDIQGFLSQDMSKMFLGVLTHDLHEVTYYQVIPNYDTFVLTYMYDLMNSPMTNLNLPMMLLNLPMTCSSSLRPS